MFAAPTAPPPCRPTTARLARGLCGTIAAAVILAAGLPAAAQVAGLDIDIDQGGEAAEPPVISSDDSGVGAAVMDGPSEPAGPYDAFPQVGANALVAPSPERSAAPPAQVTPPVPSPVVVELFTAQGCSSCPPADALLGELAGRGDVLPLAFHVDYWDYLGWTDAFARPEFTERQQSYGRSTGERAIYTPQIIVGGSDTLIDLRPATLEAMIDAHDDDPSPVDLHVVETESQVHIALDPRGTVGGPSTVELVRYLPRREVRIGAGENRGRVIAYRNVVVSVERLATWDGRQPLKLTVTPGAGGAQPLPADTRHAVLVQQLVGGRSLGPILAAVPID